MRASVLRFAFPLALGFMASLASAADAQREGAAPLDILAWGQYLERVNRRLGAEGSSALQSYSHILSQKKDPIFGRRIDKETKALRAALISFRRDFWQLIESTRISRLTYDPTIWTMREFELYKEKLRSKLRNPFLEQFAAEYIAFKVHQADQEANKKRPDKKRIEEHCKQARVAFDLLSYLAEPRQPLGIESDEIGLVLLSVQVGLASLRFGEHACKSEKWEPVLSVLPRRENEYEVDSIYLATTQIMGKAEEAGTLSYLWTSSGYAPRSRYLSGQEPMRSSKEVFEHWAERWLER